MPGMSSEFHRTMNQQSLDKDIHSPMIQAGVSLVFLKKPAPPRCGESNACVTGEDPKWILKSQYISRESKIRVTVFRSIRSFLGASSSSDR